MSFRTPNRLTFKLTGGGQTVAAPDDSSAAPIRALPPAPWSSTMVVVVDGRIARADAPKLCDQLTATLKDRSTDLVICDVGALVNPDIGTVDVLARLALTARRLGCQVRLRHARPRLQDLVALVGLCGAERPGAALPLEMEGESEQREHASGVQERGQPGDLTA
jgi:ABC-type transporter Mla MlaB component